MSASSISRSCTHILSKASVFTQHQVATCNSQRSIFWPKRQLHNPNLSTRYTTLTNPSSSLRTRDTTRASKRSPVQCHRLLSRRRLHNKSFKSRLSHNPLSHSCQVSNSNSRTSSLNSNIRLLLLSSQINRLDSTQRTPLSRQHNRHKAHSSTEERLPSRLTVRSSTPRVFNPLI